MINLPIIPSPLAFTLGRELTHTDLPPVLLFLHSNTPPAWTLELVQNTAGTNTEVSQGIPVGQRAFGLKHCNISSWTSGKVSSCHKRFKCGDSNPAQTYAILLPKSLRNFRADYTTLRNLLEAFYLFFLFRMNVK